MCFWLLNFVTLIWAPLVIQLKYFAVLPSLNKVTGLIDWRRQQYTIPCYGDNRPERVGRNGSTLRSWKERRRSHRKVRWFSSKHFKVKDIVWRLDIIREGQEFPDSVVTARCPWVLYYLICSCFTIEVDHKPSSDKWDFLQIRLCLVFLDLIRSLIGRFDCSSLWNSLFFPFLKLLTRQFGKILKRKAAKTTGETFPYDKLRLLSETYTSLHGSPLVW